MAIFKRATLKEWGLNDEQVDKIMNEAGRVFAGYTPNAEVKEKIEAAVKEAQEQLKQETNIRESDEYKRLQSDFDAYKTRQEARGADDYSSIKPKFFDNVYDLLDHSKSIPEQLEKIKEKYEEYFTPTEEKKPVQPVFSSDNDGAMPTGEEGQSFSKYWGFGKKG